MYLFNKYLGLFVVAKGSSEPANMSSIVANESSVKAKPPFVNAKRSYKVAIWSSVKAIRSFVNAKSPSVNAKASSIVAIKNSEPDHRSSNKNGGNF